MGGVPCVMVSLCALLIIVEVGGGGGGGDSSYGGIFVLFVWWSFIRMRWGCVFGCTYR
jgi:hypothetical protein